MKKNGFTLIELLIVISIIGILVALSFFGLQGAKKSSRNAQRKADLETVRQALELYKSDCGVYPDTLTSPLSGTGLGNCSGTYLTEIPEDPLGPDLRTYSYYVEPVENLTYSLCAALEEEGRPDESGCGTAGCVENCNYKVTNP